MAAMDPEKRDEARHDNRERILESIVSEFTDALRRGERPEISHYELRHPSLGEDIRELLSSITMIEDLKLQSKSARESSGSRLDGVSDLTRLGDYLMVRELGRGGMGVVFEAIHESLGRRVAIKALPARAPVDQNYIDRFRREAQAAANLHHTNIVSVFGVGQSDDIHYYVMEYVAGPSLRQVVNNLRDGAVGDLDSRRTLLTGSSKTWEPSELASGDSGAGDGMSRPDGASSFSQGESGMRRGSDHDLWAAGLAAQIADGLCYAHGHGTLHRDIKPSNLILDPQGTVWITDFGLAKLACQQDLTRTGDILGTPQYMPPEGFEGRYDERSETYCVGLTLYELATLHPAFAKASTHELIRKITSSAPTPPRKLVPGMSRDLCTIIEKAISRNPNERYQTAASLRDDLQAFVAGRPIQARKRSWAEHAWRWSRANPLAASLALLSLLLLSLVAVTASAGYLSTTGALQELSQEHRKMELQQKATLEARKRAEENERKIAAQFARAEANMAISLDAFDDMFKQFLARDHGDMLDLDIDGYQELSGIEITLTASDADFLKGIAEFYERFADQNVDSERLQNESARAFRRVANIYQLIGSFEEAIAAYQRAIDLYDKLVARRSAEGVRQVSTLVELVQTRNELAAVFRKQGDLPKSRAVLRATRVLLQIHPASPELQLELAKTLLLLGTASQVEADFSWVTQGAPDEASSPRRVPDFRSQFRRRAAEAPNQRLMRQAVQITDTLAKQQTETPETRLVRAKAHRSLATSELRQRDLPAARRSFQFAIDELLRLCEDYPKQPSYRYALALTYLAASHGDHVTDANLLDKADRLSRDLLASQPNSLEYRQLEASIKLNLAQTQVESGQPDLAIENLTAALTLLEPLTREYASVRNYLLGAATARLMLVDLFFQQKMSLRAKSILEPAIDELRAHSRETKSPRVIKVVLARHYQALSRALANLDQPRQAAQASRTARQLLAIPRSSDAGRGGGSDKHP